MKENESRNAYLLCLAALLPEVLLAPWDGRTAREIVAYGGLQTAVTACVLMAVDRVSAGWRKSRPLRAILAIWLAACGADTLCRLWGFYAVACPGQLPCAAFLLLCVAAAAWQASGTGRGLAAAAKLQLALFAAAVVLMIASGLEVFHASNLAIREAGGVPKGVLRPAPLLPPYLIFCLLRSKGPARRAAVLPFCFWGISAVASLTAELALGDSVSRGWALYRAALLGRLSIFNRLEWIQVLVWLLLCLGRLALYLYTIRLCLPRGGGWLAGGVMLAGGLALLRCAPSGAGIWTQAAGWAITSMIVAKGLWEWEDLQGSRQRR